MMSDLFSAPIFNISLAKNYTEAVKIIESAPKPWNCCIIDHHLGPDGSGLDLIKRFPQIKYKIYFTAEADAQDAVEADHLGAQVISKDRPTRIGDLVFSACQKITISFFTQGKAVGGYDTLKLPHDLQVLSVEDWAHSAHMTPRNLHDICGTQLNMQPKEALRLMLGISFLLYKDKVFASFRKDDPPVPSGFKEKCLEALNQYCVKK